MVQSPLEEIERIVNQKIISIIYSDNSEIEQEDKFLIYDFIQKIDLEKKTSSKYMGKWGR